MASGIKVANGAKLLGFTGLVSHFYYGVNVQNGSDADVQGMKADFCQYGLEVADNSRANCTNASINEEMSGVAGVYCDRSNVVARSCQVTGGTDACYVSNVNSNLDAAGAKASGGLNGFDAEYHSSIFAQGSSSMNNTNYGYIAGNTSYIAATFIGVGGNGQGNIFPAANTLQPDGTYIFNK